MLKKNNQNLENKIKLFNDCGDLKFFLRLQNTNSKNVFDFQCGLLILESDTGSFRELLTSGSRNLVSEITPDEIRRLLDYFHKGSTVLQ